jgi:hypothetical protein
MNMFRHGDVILTSVEEPYKLASDMREAPRDENGYIVLAKGTATGHGHRIRSKEARLFQGADARVLVTTSDVELTHEEHKTITLPSGTYTVTIARNYTPDGWRDVQD